jgi:VWFA-related protein
LGLTRDDFELYENGERVEISSFAAYAPSRPPISVPAAVAVEEATPPAAGASSVLVVLLDNQSLTLGGRKRLLGPVHALVAAGLGPNQRVGVAVQDTPGALRMVLPPTSDAAAVMAALERAAEVTPRGNLLSNETTRLANDLLRAPSPGEETAVGAAVDMAQIIARSLYREIEVHGRQLEMQALSTAAALEQLVQAVGGMPGRKAIVMVSGGIPQRPAEALLSAWNNRYSEFDRQWRIAQPFDGREGEINDVLLRASRHANGSRVAIYGLVSPAVPRGVSAEMSAGGVWTPTEEWTAEQNVRDSMERLALPTGGRVAFDGAGIPLLLADLRADLDSYYSLAYEPSDRKRGKDHALRVEVTRPGLVVRHRSTYRERTSAELMVEHTRAALLLAYQNNPLGLVVELGALVETGKQRVGELPMTVLLPMSGLVLVPQGPFHEGRLTIFIAASDEAGRSSPVAAVEVPVRVPNEKLLESLSQQLAYRTRVAVRETRQRIAVTVRDELGNQAATVFVEHPPDEAASAAVTNPAGAARDGQR